MRYLGYEWDENCQNCSKVFKVFEFYQTSICNECYENHRDYYDLQDTCGILWLLIGFISFICMVFSLVTGAWISFGLAILAGLSSFFLLCVPELIIDKDKQPPKD